MGYASWQKFILLTSTTLLLSLALLPSAQAQFVLGDDAESRPEVVALVPRLNQANPRAAERGRVEVYGSFTQLWRVLTSTYMQLPFSLSVHLGPDAEGIHGYGVSYVTDLYKAMVEAMRGANRTLFGDSKQNLHLAVLGDWVEDLRPLSGIDDPISTTVDENVERLKDMVLVQLVGQERVEAYLADGGEKKVAWAPFKDSFGPLTRSQGSAINYLLVLNSEESHDPNQRLLDMALGAAAAKQSTVTTFVWGGGDCDIQAPTEPASEDVPENRVLNAIFELALRTPPNADLRLELESSSGTGDTADRALLLLADLASPLEWIGHERYSKVGNLAVRGGGARYYTHYGWLSRIRSSFSDGRVTRMPETLDQVRGELSSAAYKFRNFLIEHRLLAARYLAIAKRLASARELQLSSEQVGTLSQLYAIEPLAALSAVGKEAYRSVREAKKAIEALEKSVAEREQQDLRERAEPR